MLHHISLISNSVGHPWSPPTPLHWSLCYFVPSKPAPYACWIVELNWIKLFSEFRFSWRPCIDRWSTCMWHVWHIFCFLRTQHNIRPFFSDRLHKIICSHSSFHCPHTFCSPSRCSWWFGRTQNKATRSYPGSRFPGARDSRPFSFPYSRELKRRHSRENENE